MSFAPGRGPISSGSRRVGILTLHYGFNEGAVLQAYALAGLLRRHLPFANVEIVDQRYPSKLSVIGPANTRRTAALQQAIDDWLPLGELRLRTNDSAAARSALRGRYDLVVFGSDQVWSLQFRRRFRRLFRGGLFAAQTSPFFPAYPNIYWPCDELPMAQASFAAAVGSLRWEDIPRRLVASMRRGLSACSLLSVRDERSMRFMEWLGNDLAARTSMIADPTFSDSILTELSDGEALARLQSRLAALGVDFSRPRCGIVGQDREPVQELAGKLRSRGVQLIGITTRNSFCDVNLFEEAFHPLDWARIFRFMSFCLSERMHACIFCLLQQTPFMALDINVVRGDPETKVRGLLRTFGLEKNCLPADELDSEVLARACTEMLEEQWDWTGINRIIASQRMAQAEFLQRMSALLANG